MERLQLIVWDGGSWISTTDPCKFYTELSLYRLSLQSDAEAPEWKAGADCSSLHSAWGVHSLQPAEFLLGGFGYSTQISVWHDASCIGVYSAGALLKPFTCVFIEITKQCIRGV